MNDQTQIIRVNIVLSFLALERDIASNKLSRRSKEYQLHNPQTPKRLGNNEGSRRMYELHCAKEIE